MYQDFVRTSFQRSPTLYEPKTSPTAVQLLHLDRIKKLMKAGLLPIRFSPEPGHPLWDDRDPVRSLADAERRDDTYWHDSHIRVNAGLHLAPTVVLAALQLTLPFDSYAFSEFLRLNGDVASGAYVIERGAGRRILLFRASTNGKTLLPFGNKMFAEHFVPTTKTEDGKEFWPEVPLTRRIMDNLPFITKELTQADRNWELAHKVKLGPYR